MKKYQTLDIEGAILDEEQQKKHLEKMEMQHILKAKSSKEQIRKIKDFSLICSCPI